MRKAFSLALSLLCFASYAQEPNEIMPEFKGGESALRNFLSQNLSYPVYARDNCIMGTVYVTFKVTESGELDSISLIRSIHKTLDEEALRVVRLMSGKWVPGKINGTVAEIRYTLPIKYTLQNTGCKDANDYYNEGVKLSQQKKYEEALISFEKALKINFTDIDALYNSAVMKIKLNDIQGACEYLNTIKRLGKPDADALLSKYCN